MMDRQVCSSRAILEASEIVSGGADIVIAVGSETVTAGPDGKAGAVPTSVVCAVREKVVIDGVALVMPTSRSARPE
jgi:hypothetical protein